PRENPLDVLDQHVALNIDRGAGPLAPQRGQLQRMRDQRDAETPAADRKHGQAHAVDRDRALLDQVTHLRRGNFKRVQLRVAFRRDRDDFAYAVDVTRNQVPAEQFIQRETTLEVDPGAHGQRSQRRAPQRFGRHVHRYNAAPLSAPFLDHGETRAVDRDRIADRNARERQRGAETQQRTLVGALYTLDRAEILDDACEQDRLSMPPSGAEKNPEKSYFLSVCSATDPFL